MREQACGEQKGRRIMPGEVALIALAERRDLNLLLDIPIVGLRGVAVEHQAAGGPDVDEIGRDAEAPIVEDPPMGEERRREKYALMTNSTKHALNRDAGIARAPEQSSRWIWTW